MTVCSPRPLTLAPPYPPRRPRPTTHPPRNHHHTLLLLPPQHRAERERRPPRATAAPVAGWIYGVARPHTPSPQPPCSRSKGVARAMASAGSISAAAARSHAWMQEKDNCTTPRSVASRLVPRVDLVDELLDEAEIVRARHSPLSLLVQKEQRSEDRVGIARREVRTDCTFQLEARRSVQVARACNVAKVVGVRHRHLAGGGHESELAVAGPEAPQYGPRVF
eukprot:scaffold9016_cov52-Phaeocystis_antarctica.AAC.1